MVSGAAASDSELRRLGVETYTRTDTGEGIEITFLDARGDIVGTSVVALTASGTFRSVYTGWGLPIVVEATVSHDAFRVESPESVLVGTVEFDPQRKVFDVSPGVRDL